MRASRAYGEVNVTYSFIENSNAAVLSCKIRRLYSITSSARASIIGGDRELHPITSWGASCVVRRSELGMSISEVGSRAGMPGTRSACLFYPWIAVAIVAPPRPSAPCQMLTSHTHHTNAKEDRMWGGPLKWKKGCDWRLC